MSTINPYSSRPADPCRRNPTHDALYHLTCHACSSTRRLKHSFRCQGALADSPNLPRACSRCKHQYCLDCTAEGQYLLWRCWCCNITTYYDFRGGGDDDSCPMCNQLRDSTSSWEWEKKRWREDVWGYGRDDFEFAE